MKLSDYLKNRQTHDQTPFVIENGIGFHVMKGYRLSVSEFNELFPINTTAVRLSHVRYKGADIDSRRNWIND